MIRVSRAIEGRQGSGDSSTMKEHAMTDVQKASPHGASVETQAGGQVEERRGRDHRNTFIITKFWWS